MLAIIDYGLGNVRSVLNALEHIGAKASITRDAAVLKSADGLILPGVGAFGAGMSRLRQYGLADLITRMVGEGRPLLGICLGFQMLMRSSTEDGETEGLHLMPHPVVRLPVEARLPHYGWSQVISESREKAPALMKGLEGDWFYFVHSYGVVRPQAPMVGGITRYDGCELLALVEHGNVFGTQFHPEKSGEAGLEMLRNFVDLVR
ncbi:imidazole glycerol phosphate synthase subunit HisH [Hyphomicrobium album]|uniref:imidazole glycerol phosphate synthase subunit HisH n=1 Tax=Hyphomicrobium album TaxID=2665159 RepID=UPI0012B91844|nr:imidazole glycerol phosphate synthase subunit HisH [Hyphomicrobium album]